MKIPLQILIIIILCSFIQAQQGKYNRKSISSLGKVWHEGELKNLDESYEKYINEYVKAPRFDYNNLPINILNKFYKEALNASDLDGIERALERTVIEEIVEILNDPDIQKNRALALKDESDFQSFAATKAKSLSITTEELIVLMNSAYIYLPFVTYSKPSRLQLIPRMYDRFKYKVEGGIIWWNIKVDSNGTTKIKKVITVKGQGVATRNIGIFQFLNDLVVLTGGMQARMHGNVVDRAMTPENIMKNLYDTATKDFIQNLSIHMQEFADFIKLSGQIVESAGKNYNIEIGKKEGLQLDQGFNVVDFYEEEGLMKAKKIGFGRVIKIGDNTNNPKSYSIVKHKIGKVASEGSVLTERPSVGSSWTIMRGQSSINIPKDLFSHINQYGFSSAQIFNNDITEARNTTILRSYNISSDLTGSQTWLNLEFSRMVVDKSNFNKEIVEDDFHISSNSFYTGIVKKFNLGRGYLGMGFNAGLESFSIGGKMYVETGYSEPAPGEFYLYFHDIYWSTTYLTEYELLITPDLSFNIGMNLRKAFRDSLPDMELWDYVNKTDGYPTTWNIRPGEYDDWSESLIDGLTFNVGIRYSPRTNLRNALFSLGKR